MKKGFIIAISLTLIMLSSVCVYAQDNIVSVIEVQEDAVSVIEVQDEQKTYDGYKIALNVNSASSKSAIKTGLYKIDGQWKYYENGKFKKVTGLVKKPADKQWYYVEDGLFAKKTGLVKRVDNKQWYYVEKGAFSKKTGLVKRIDNGKWYYVYKGAFTKSTGLVKRIGDGKWFYVENGAFTKATGLVSRVSDGEKFYVKRGAFNKKTGFVDIVGKKEKAFVRYGKYDPSIKRLRVNEMAAARLDIVGWDLRKAFDWSAFMLYQSAQPTGITCEEYALWSYAREQGHCYGKAASFYYMALELGYDAHFVKGYVYTYNGREEHGWVELVIDGKVYVCDPSFHGAQFRQNGRTGYMVQYGQKGTWKYTDYAREN